MLTDNRKLGTLASEMEIGPSRELLITASIPLVLFLVLPCIALIVKAVSVDPLAGIVQPEVADAVLLSLTTTAITTFITLLFGTPVAYLIARKNFRGKNALSTLIDLPVVLPPAVAGIALLMAFGRRGLLGGFLTSMDIEVAFTRAAVICAQLFVSSPLYVRSAAAGFANVNRELEQISMIDGASAWQAFRKVTLPLSFPTLLGGVVLTWARALGEFGATIIFAGNFPGKTQTMPLAIYLGLEIDMRTALSLSLILLIISFVVLFVVRRLLHQRGW